MRMIADTNVIVRAVVGDDEVQSRAARQALSSAEQVIIGRHAFCEMAWVLRQSYKFPKTAILSAIRGYLDADNVITDSGAIEAGLKAMEAGGDFADGVIAYEGQWLGGEMFVSFDKQAVAAVAKLGQNARLLT